VRVTIFQSHVGHFRSREASLLLLLWRAADCGVNSVSDAVHHAKGTLGEEVVGSASRISRSQAMRLHTGDKISWLKENGLLPLPLHQARGTYFVRVKRRITGLNPKTGQQNFSLRPRLEELGSDVLTLAKLGPGALFSADDTLG
jgi:hypothetical protein